MAPGEPRAALSCSGCDQVDRDGHITVEPAPLEVSVPDARLAGVLEPGRCHDVAQQRDVGEQTGVEDKIGVGGESLVRGESIGSAEVDGLSADEHDGADMRLQRSERVEGNTTRLDVFDLRF